MAPESFTLHFKWLLGRFILYGSREIALFILYGFWEVLLLNLYGFWEVLLFILHGFWECLLTVSGRRGSLGCIPFFLVALGFVFDAT